MNNINKELEDKKWEQYNEYYKIWKLKYKDDLTSMDAQMSKPNKPNYYRANND